MIGINRRFIRQGNVPTIGSPIDSLTLTQLTGQTNTISAYKSLTSFPVSVIEPIKDFAKDDVAFVSSLGPVNLGEREAFWGEYDDNLPFFPNDDDPFDDWPGQALDRQVFRFRPNPYTQAVGVNLLVSMAMDRIRYDNPPVTVNFSKRIIVSLQEPLMGGDFDINTGANVPLANELDRIDMTNFADLDKSVVLPNPIGSYYPPQWITTGTIYDPFSERRPLLIPAFTPGAEFAVRVDFSQHVRILGLHIFEIFRRVI